MNRIALFFHSGRPAQHVEQRRLQVQRMMAIGRAFLEVIVEVPAPVRRSLAQLLHESPPTSCIAFRERRLFVRQRRQCGRQLLRKPACH